MKISILTLFLFNIAYIAFAQHKVLKSIFKRPAPPTAPTASPIPNSPNLNATNLFVFSPSNLNLHASMTGQNFSINLASKPSDKVHLRLGTNGLFQLNQCELVFTPENYKEPQKVQAFVSGAVIKTGDESNEGGLDVAASSCDSNFNQKTAQMKISRETKNPVSCSILGDPHFESFDNTKFDFFGKLLKNPRTEVQIQMTDCNGPEKLCGKNLAIRHMDTVALVTLSKSKDAENMLNVEMFGPSSNIQVLSGKHPVRLQTNDGVMLMVSGVKRHDNPHAETEITAPGFYGESAGGLCGKLSGLNQNDLAQKFTVPDNFDLFQCKDKCANAKTENSLPPSSACDAKQKVNLQCSKAVKIGEISRSQPTPSPVKTVIQTKKEIVVPQPVVSVAKKDVFPDKSGKPGTTICDKTLEKARCDGNVDKNFYIKSCAYDIQHGADPESTAKGALQSFNEQCASTTNILLNSPSRKAQEIAKKLISENKMETKQVVVQEKVENGKVSEQVVQDSNGSILAKSVKFSSSAVCNDEAAPPPENLLTEGECKDVSS